MKTFGNNRNLFERKYKIHPGYRDVFYALFTHQPFPHRDDMDIPFNRNKIYASLKWFSFNSMFFFLKLNLCFTQQNIYVLDDGFFFRVHFFY